MPDERDSLTFRLGRRELLAAGITGAALAPLTSGGRAAADQALDIQLLQTAASIENALLSAYVTILGLPVLSSANSTLKNTVFWAAHNHHAEHARAFNDAVTKLGGRPQNALNPTLAQMLGQARLGDLGQIVELAHELETVAAQTYQNNVAILSDLDARKLTASTLAVEAQHAAVLLVTKALVAANLADEITSETGTFARFPAEIATVGSPETFAKVDQARPAAEGAVR